MKKALTALVSIALLLILWHYAAVQFESAAFPKPMVVISELFGSRSLLARASLSTFADSLFGLVIGLTIAVFLRSIYQVLPLSRTFFAPLLLVSQLTPKIVVFPLLTILMSPFAAKQFIIAAFSLFPFLDSFSVAERETPRQIIEQLRLMGSTRWQIFWKFEIRHILPFMLSSTKVAFIFAFMGAMTVEFYKPSGLGKIINEGFGDTLAYDVGWAGIICSTLSGMLGWYFFITLETLVNRKFYPHKQPIG